MNEDVKKLIDEMIQQQEERLLRAGRIMIPRLTSEDVLQPNDYPELENNPSFRYEEGTLMGMHMIRTALLAYFKYSIP